MTEWELQSERPGGQREKERKKQKKGRRKRDEKVLEERITLPSATDGGVGGGVDLWLRVCLVFSLHSPEWWDCGKTWSSESP